VAWMVVLILSQIRQVYTATAQSADCPNSTLRVFSNRIVIGDIPSGCAISERPVGGCVVSTDGKHQFHVYFETSRRRGFPTSAISVLPGGW